MWPLKVTMCRHGESEANAAGYSQGFSPGRLTLKGRRQAESLGQSLFSSASGEPILYDYIWCSDLSRVQETLDIATESGGMTSLRNRVMYDPLLREKNAGIFDGKPRAVMEQARKKYGNIRTFRPDHGECWEDLQNRVKQFITSMINRIALDDTHQGNHVLVVTSGGFIMEFINAFIYNSSHPGKYYPNCAANCSTYIFQINEDGSTEMLVENKKPSSLHPSAMEIHAVQTHPIVAPASAATASSPSSGMLIRRSAMKPVQSKAKTK